MDDFRFTKRTTRDVDEQAAALSAWSQRYEQISSGPFTGNTEELRVGPVQLFHEKADKAVFQATYDIRQQRTDVLSAAQTPDTMSSIVATAKQKAQEAMEKGQVPRRDLSVFTARQLLALRDPRLTERLNKVWGTLRPPAKDKAALLARYQALVAPDKLKKSQTQRAHGADLCAQGKLDTGVKALKSALKDIGVKPAS